MTIEELKERFYDGCATECPVCIHYVNSDVFISHCNLFNELIEKAADMREADNERKD